ncbi:MULTISPECIES: sugar transferase [Myxococcaceae]|uniref:sugar transferase n=1 Tax=Myxococcaceae TaxID=31 RepID=UPI00188E2FA4|nr:MULTISPECIES: sugar transferase [Myxococcaceae]MBF5042762.1 sugar transferase [Simulacricoccus sp. 17bor-14]
MIDAFLLVSAFALAFQLREQLSGFPLLGNLQPHVLMVPVAVSVWGFAGYWSGLYSGRRLSLWREAKHLVRLTLYTGLVLASLAFLLKLEQSRPLIVLYVLSALCQTLAFRLLQRIFGWGQPKEAHRVIVVGSGAQAEAICRMLRTRSEHGAELVGLVTEEHDTPVPPGVRRLGILADSEAIFRREIVDEVIFAVPRTALFEVQSAFQAAEDLGLDTRLCLTFLPNRFARVGFSELDGVPSLSFTSAPGKPLELVLKRAFDIIVSLTALVLLAPVFGAIAVAIKLTSKGPVFFSQSRTGLNGREFRLWKFRSMVVDAEARLKELASQNEMSGPVFKIDRDPRITGIGHFIRRTSLDELPQFWNVLIGDMSVVGPRPLFDVKQYDERWQCRRLSVKPGITCTWQISGRNQIDFATWMKLDLAYIDQWSLGLDLKIFLKTIPAVLLGKGAR